MARLYNLLNEQWVSESRKFQQKYGPGQKIASVETGHYNNCSRCSGLLCSFSWIFVMTSWLFSVVFHFCC